MTVSGSLMFNVIIPLVPLCSAPTLNTEHFVKLLQGYIIISPDTPLTRRVTKNLLDVFKNMNYMVNLVKDFNNVAEKLQDTLYNSDLPTGLKVRLLYKFSD